MLGQRNSSAILAVSELKRAKHFYAETLGLGLVREGMGVMTFRTGSTQLDVYLSDYAGTNRANAVVFDAGGDLETIVADLREKGVVFERYEIDGADFRDGVHYADGMKLVWIKDPDGNIIHILASGAEASS